MILWDLNNPAAPNSTILAKDQPSMWSVTFSPDGQRLAVGNQDGTVSLWDLSGTEPISRTLPGRHTDWAFSVAFDRDGHRLASAGKDGKIILWSKLSSSEPVSHTLSDHTAWVNNVVFSPDGARLASGSDDGTVRLWDLAAETPSSRVLDDLSDQGFAANKLAFSPGDGKLLAVGWGNAEQQGQLRVYALAKQDAVPQKLAGHTGQVWDLAFDPTRPRRVISVSTKDTDPIAWDLIQPSGFPASQPLSLPITPTLQTTSPDGRWLATVGEDRTVYLTDTVTSGQPISFTVAMSITAAALSADGGQLALAGCEPGVTQAAGPASAGQKAEASPKPGSPTPTPTPTAKPSEDTRTSGTRTSGPAPADCKLEVWSVGAQQTISPASRSPSPNGSAPWHFIPGWPATWP